MILTAQRPEGASFAPPPPREPQRLAEGKEPRRDEGTCGAQPQAGLHVTPPGLAGLGRGPLGHYKEALSPICGLHPGSISYGRGSRRDYWPPRSRAFTFSQAHAARLCAQGQKLCSTLRAIHRLPLQAQACVCVCVCVCCLCLPLFSCFAPTSSVTSPCFHLHHTGRQQYNTV